MYIVVIMILLYYYRIDYKFKHFSPTKQSGVIYFYTLRIVKLVNKKVTLITIQALLETTIIRM